MKRKFQDIMCTLLSWSFIVAGIVEAVWGLSQVYGYAPSNHSLYSLTGSFYNPGPYSGFIAMCLPIALYEWLRREGIGKYIALFSLVLMIVILPSGMSRSAWIAVTVSSIYVVVMHHRYPFRTCLHRYWKIFLVGGFLLVILGCGAYHWKKDSADGRLLMWKVATHAVMERPWSGYGWNYVAGAYGDAQERYFASGMATEQEKYVAGAPEYVFNEYLQVAMAWGVPVLCVILLTVVSCFYMGHRNRQLGICGALVSLGVFAFSSYPFQFIEFMIAFVCLLVACLMSCHKIWVQLLAFVMGIGLGLYLYNIQQDGGNRKAHVMFERAYDLHKAGNWNASSEILKETMRISSDAMILNIIGKNCQALGKYKEAEKWFLSSTHRLPNRIYPYYLLTKLYAEVPEIFPKEKLEWAAKMVLEKEPKVQSTAIREMREEVRKFILE